MKVTLTRQVTDNRMRILTPGEHDLPEARYYVQQGWTTETPEPAASPLAPAAEQLLPVIPSGWEGLHPLQRIQLASEISGGANVKTDEADTIIRNELQRRGEPVPEPTSAPKSSRRAAKKRGEGHAA